MTHGVYGSFIFVCVYRHIVYGNNVYLLLYFIAAPVITTHNRPIFNPVPHFLLTIFTKIVLFRCPEILNAEVPSQADL